jgi:hypothetical protein
MKTEREELVNGGILSDKIYPVNQLQKIIRRPNIHFRRIFNKWADIVFD